MTKRKHYGWKEHNAMFQNQPDIPPDAKEATLYNWVTGDLKCRKCGAREGEMRPRNEYNPPKARHLRECALCYHYYCDWCFGPHFCGESEETDERLRFTEMLGLDRYR